MIRKLSLAMVFAGAFALSAAAAETVAPKAGVADPVADTAMVPVLKDAVTPTVVTDTPAVVGSFVLTAEQDKAWINKSIYSSDGKNVGEVVSFQRDAANMVIGLYADIGGFLGIGETRVAVTSAQFKLVGDRAVLSMTAEQAKVLPKAKI